MSGQLQIRPFSRAASVILILLLSFTVTPRAQEYDTDAAQQDDEAAVLNLEQADLADEARDEDYRLYLENRLKMKQAQLDLTKVQMEKARAKRELDQSLMLFDSGIVSQKQVNEARKNFEELSVLIKQKELDLEQVKSDVLSEASFVSVAEARKYKSEEEKRMVDVALVNDSLAGRIQAAFSDFSPDELRDLMTIHDIRVSLRDQGIIAEPYEIRIPSLAFEAQTNLTFRLLKDVDEVGVDLRFGQKHLIRQVYLKKSSTSDLPTIESPQFSQEGALGSEILFPIIIEHLSEDETSFRLTVLGLDPAFPYKFVVPESNASVTQVRFTPKTPKHEINLVVSVPKKLDISKIGYLQTFEAHVLRTAELKKLAPLMREFGRDKIPDDRIEGIRTRTVELELVPRGVGEVDLLFANSFKTIKKGQPARFIATIHNSGTLTVRNIEPELNLSPGWEAEVDPPRFDMLAAGKRQDVEIVFKHDRETDIGEYSLRLLVRGEVGSEDHESPLRAVTVKIEASANVLGNVLVIGLLIGVMAVIGGLSLWVARR